ncbi:hypothetical protein H920_00116 [Fukomys damarensis]|uniref:Uncharacterized protein n=1 Tax=Fukomys damarensis TaxID=885580 RepID=A0A091E523_FUKDA|nr:hypothetical protein H920_00116 [Fukomys damarensis]
MFSESHIVEDTGTASPCDRKSAHSLRDGAQRYRLSQSPEIRKQEEEQWCPEGAAGKCEAVGAVHLSRCVFEPKVCEARFAGLRNESYLGTVFQNEARL